MMIVNLLEMSFVAIKYVDNVLLLMLFDDGDYCELVGDEFCCHPSMLNMLMTMMMMTMIRSL